MRDEWRYYPAGSLASHTIGFVGYQGDRKVGVYGLERQWQDTLLKSSSGLYVNPFAELFTSIGSALTTDPAGSLVLSSPQLSRRSSRNSRMFCRVSMRTNTPKEAYGIIMDPKTGEIIALGAKPISIPTRTTFQVRPFSPIRWSRMSTRWARLMKPLTVAAGLPMSAPSRRR